MPLGNLDRRIIIQQYSESADSFGERDKTWTTYSTVWAEKIDGSGSEKDVNNQIVAEQSIDFRIRYDSGVTEEMRINYDSKHYNIESISEEGRERFLLLKTYKVDGEA